MLSRNFMGSLPIVAQAMGEKMGVKVVIGAPGACTDGDTIYLPALPDQDDRALRLARGYLDHEAAHVAETQFKIWPKGPEKGLTNLFEDIRIETAQMRKYPGSRRNLEALTAEAIKEGLFELMDENEQYHPYKLLHDTLLYRLRWQVLKQSPMQPLAETAMRIWDQQMPKAVADRIEKEVIPLVDQQKTTQDALDLARKVLEILKEEQQDAEEQASEGPQSEVEGGEQGADQQDDANEGGQSGEGEEGSGNDASGQAADADSDASDDRSGGGQASSGAQSDEDGEGAGAQPGSDQEGEEGQQDLDSGSGEEEGEGDDQPRGQGEQDDSDAPEGADQSNGNPDQGEESTESGATGGASAGASDADSPSESSEGESSGRQVSGQKGSEEPSETAEKLRRMVEEWDQAEVASDLGDGMKEVLDELAGEALQAGRSMIALPEVVNIRPGTPIQRQDVAKETRALRTRLASKLEAMRAVRSRTKRVGRKLDTRKLHRLRLNDTRIFREKQQRPMVNTAIQIIVDQSSSMSLNARDRLAMKACMAVTLAAQGISNVEVAVAGYTTDPNDRPQVMPIKAFQAPVNEGRFRACALDFTPTGEAMWWGAYQLARRREDRKILMIITDGQSNGDVDPRDAQRQISDAGIETIGIGVGYDIPATHADQVIRVDNPGDLPQTLFSALHEAIIQRRKAA